MRARTIGAAIGATLTLATLFGCAAGGDEVTTTTEPTTAPTAEAEPAPAPRAPAPPVDNTLDALYDSCAAGDMYACDRLYMESPVGSLEETFGDFCGGLGHQVGVWCSEQGAEEFGTGAPADLTALYDECAEDGGYACDLLFWTSPVGSAEETFGAICGGHGFWNDTVWCSEQGAEEFGWLTGDEVTPTFADSVSV
jgi:hypothetical protein